MICITISCVGIVAVDRVYFSRAEFDAFEGDGVLEVTLLLERAPNLFNDVIVTVKTRDLAGANSAQGMYFRKYIAVHTNSSPHEVCD